MTVLFLGVMGFDTKTRHDAGDGGDVPAVEVFESVGFSSLGECSSSCP
jgi:hypothetical protein